MSQELLIDGQNLEQIHNSILPYVINHNNDMRGYNESGMFKEKSMDKKDTANDLQLEADIFSEQKIFEFLHEISPGIPTFSEESSAINGATRDYSAINEHEVFWLVDPLDGTGNYRLKSGRSFDWGFTVCLLVYGQPQISFVGLPAYQEVYSAYGDNESYMHISGICTKISFSSEGISTQTPTLYSESTGKRYLRAKMLPINEILAKLCDLRNTGCTAANFRNLFIGMADAVGSAGHPWDWFAATHILANAGGCANQFNGKPLNMSTTLGCIASNNMDLQNELLSLISGTQNNNAAVARISLQESIKEINADKIVIEGDIAAIGFDNLKGFVAEVKSHSPITSEIYVVAELESGLSDELYFDFGVVTVPTFDGLPNFQQNFAGLV